MQHWTLGSLNHRIIFIIFISIIIAIIDRLIGLVISMSNYWSWGRGFDSRNYHNFKNFDKVWNKVHPASWGQLGS